MDPVTAALNAFAAFNQFLATPAGQTFANGVDGVFLKIVGHFEGLLGRASNQVAPTPTQTHIG